MNKIEVIGRLTNDIEVKTSNTGMSYARFNIASNSKRKNTDGTKKADFFSCSVFNKGAEVLAQYCHKGDLIMVVGSMDSTKKDDRVYWDLIVEDFELCGGNKNALETNSTSEKPRELKAENIDEAFLPF